MSCSGNKRMEIMVRIHWLQIFEITPSMFLFCPKVFFGGRGPLAVSCYLKCQVVHLPHDTSTIQFDGALARGLLLFHRL